MTVVANSKLIVTIEEGFDVNLHMTVYILVKVKVDYLRRKGEELMG